MSLRRVVVTGMGAVTPVGLDVPSTWDALVHGRSGGASVEGFESSDLGVRIAGQVKNFDPTQYLDRKEARRMDRFLQLGMVASQEAMRDSGLKICPDNAEQGAATVSRWVCSWAAALAASGPSSTRRSCCTRVDPIGSAHLWCP